MYAFEELKREASSVIEKACGEKADFVKPPEGMGDIGSTVAFSIAKKIRKSPPQIAREIAQKIKLPEKGMIAKVEAKGPYINFFVNDKFRERVLVEAGNKLYGSGEKKKERVLIEHTSVNPSGPVHVGRFRNPIIGDALVRLHKFLDYQVHVQNYINDVGKQIAIIAWAKEKGIKPKKELIEKYKKYKNKPDFETFFIYVPANAQLASDDKAEKEVGDFLQRCEAGDIKSLEKLRKISEHCLKGQLQILERCGFHYDEFVFESRFIENKSVEKLNQKLKSLPECQQLPNGAYSLDLSKYGIKKEEGTVFQRANGTSVYLTRDVCFHLEKLKKFDRSINVLGEDHKIEGEEILAILDLLGEKTDKHKVVFFSFVNLAGKKMSTRMGETVPLDEVIDEGVEKAYKEVKKKSPDLPEKEKREIAEAVGIGAIKYYIIKTEPLKNIVFDWDSALDFTGDTGPYLQYTHARANSILKKAGQSQGFDVSYLKEKEEKDLIDLLARFPDIAEQACEQAKPYTVANYAHALADKFNTFYHAHQVIQEDKNLEKARLALVKAVKVTLGNALELIGLKAPERM
jgi:arginyl-tRNA synthetase